MTWGADTVVAVAALVLLGIVAVFAFALYRDRVLERRVIIKEAEDLFRQHFQAVNKLVDDPATPRLVKAFVVEFSLGINDAEVSSAFTRQVVNKSHRRGEARPRHDLEQVFDQVESLKVHREDLVQAFYDVALTGARAVVLREAVRDNDIYRALRLAGKVPANRSRETTKDLIEHALGSSSGPNGCDPMPA